MRTEQLIDDLTKNAEPVSANRVPMRLAAALVVGAVAVIALQLQTIGIRQDAAMAWASIAAKLAGIAALSVAWLWLLRQLATPGNAPRTQWLIALGAAASVGLLALFTPFTLNGLWGCVSQVTLLSLPALLALGVGLRWCAPTKPTETGLAAGILAGALAASGYSLGCMTDDPSLVAFRYGIAILICGVIGAFAGRFALRW